MTWCIGIVRLLPTSKSLSRARTCPVQCYCKSSLWSTLFSMRARDSRNVRVSSLERGVPGADPARSRDTRLLLLSWNGAGTVGPWERSGGDSHDVQLAEIYPILRSIMLSGAVFKATALPLSCGQKTEPRGGGGANARYLEVLMG